jgi:hypothetical protein
MLITYFEFPIQTQRGGEKVPIHQTQKKGGKLQELMDADANAYARI